MRRQSTIITMRFYLSFFLFLTQLLQTLGRTETGKGMTIIHQNLRMAVDKSHADLFDDRVHAGPPISGLSSWFSPSQRKPSISSCSAPGTVALQIGILDAQDKLSASLTGKQIDDTAQHEP